MKKITFIAIVAAIIIVIIAGTAVYFIFFYNKEIKSSQVNPSPTAKTETMFDVPEQERPLNVVVSTDMVREILYVLAKSRTSQPHILIKPGQSPLTYKPTQEDEDKMMKADLVLYIGLGLEQGCMDLIKKVSKTVRCEAIAETLDKSELLKSTEYKSGYDPHVWWSPQLWEKVALRVVRILAEIDPQFEFNYGSLYMRYGESMSLLDRRYIETWSGYIPPESKVIITLNPVFTYFGAKYGYKVMSLYTPASPDSVSPKWRETIADFIVANKVPVIFPEVDWPKTEIELLQTEVKKKGYKVKIAEPLYSYSLDQTNSINYVYINAGRKVMDNIYAALKPEGAPEMPEH
jgi:manganese/zinc/iron transport system substrate-binding protein